MKPVKLILAAIVGFCAGACSNEYYTRSDSIRFEAGEAVATNAAVQIPNPRPPRSQDTNIPMDPVKAQKAIEKYRKGEEEENGNGSNGGPFQPTINANQ